MYNIAIPSYKREQQLQEKTLRVLEKYNVPPDRVTIFVADKEQEEVYNESLKNNIYNNVQLAVPTIGAARNFIEQEYYNEGDYVVSFDDDLTGIYRWVNEKAIEPIQDIENELINAGFEAMMQTGSKCWGIYAASNPYFMSNTTTTKLSYIIASCYGFIATHDPFLKRETNHGEDYEYSIRQYIRNGKVFRFNNLTVKTKYFGTGGLEEYRNNRYIYESISRIEEMFPNHCTMYFKKDGRAELRLKKWKG